MTEAQARAAPRAFVAVGDNERWIVERWIAEQRWDAIPDGWSVRERLHGWRFRVEPVAGWVRVVMSAAGGAPAVWVVPVRPG